MQDFVDQNIIGSYIFLTHLTRWTSSNNNDPLRILRSQGIDILIIISHLIPSPIWPFRYPDPVLEQFAQQWLQKTFVRTVFNEEIDYNLITHQ